MRSRRTQNTGVLEARKVGQKIVQPLGVLRELHNAWVTHQHLIDRGDDARLEEREAETGVRGGKVVGKSANFEITLVLGWMAPP